MKCVVCEKEALKNKIICSEQCSEIRLKVFNLMDKYFPTNGCDNCWGDLGGRCSDECHKEFSNARKFGQDLWNLVILTLNNK